MPKNQTRVKTQYQGVFFMEAICPATGKPDRAFYLRYRKDGRVIEEKAGWARKDDMSAAKAARIRAARIGGDLPTNEERRVADRAAKAAEEARWTFDRLWQEYKVHREANKGLVVDGYRYEKFVRPAFGEKEPAELLRLDVDRLRVKLSKKLAPQTVKHVLALLKRLVNFGANKGLCARPGFEIELPKVNNQTTEDLSTEELQRLLAAIEEEPHVIVKNLMKLIIYSGMRRGECLRLRWADVDFERGFINIREPKGGTDQKIPLNDAARELLAGHPKSESPFVFPNPEGGQYQNIRWAVNRIRERAGLPEGFRPLHGLRHHFASTLASSGKVDMYVLQRLLTHKSPQMTQRYSHLRDDALRKASNLAGDLIGRAAHAQGNGEAEAPAEVVNMKGRKK